MKKIISIIVCSFAVSAVMAQQDALNTLFVQNPSLANPAYAGAKDVLSVNLGTRIQWTGVDGAPRTSNLNFSTPLEGNNIAVGFNVLNDRIGPIDQTSLTADIAYKLNIDKTSSLRVGIRAGVNLFTADFMALDLQEPDGGGTGDPSFAQNYSGEILPVLGLGVYYSNDVVFAGVSTPSVIAFELEGVEGTNVTTYRQKQHIFGMLGANFKVNADVTLQPALTARFVSGAPVSLDVRLLADLYEKFAIGALYRYKDAVGGLLQFTLSEQLKLGYAYDYTTSDFGNYNNGTHEIMLGYDFIYRRGRVNSPRYF